MAIASLLIAFSSIVLEALEGDVLGGLLLLVFPRRLLVENMVDWVEVDRTDAASEVGAPDVLKKGMVRSGM